MALATSEYPQSQPQTEKPTVLLLDDDKAVLGAIRRILRKEAFKVVCMSLASEAFRYLDSHPVSVVVVDLTMPEMDGFAVLDILEKRYPETVRIVLSGRTDGKTLLEAINSGRIYRYIVKPWNDDELKAALQQAVEIYTLRESERQLMEELEAQNRNLEEQVQRRTRQLLAMQSRAEIGKYASELVHNLKNPLQAVIGAVELIEMSMDEQATDLSLVREHLTIARSGAKDLRKIINSVLVHVRNRERSELEWVDVNRVIEQELAFFKMNRFFKNEILLKKDLMNNLPAMLGNRIQIKQILDNLMQNAIDAMETADRKELFISTGEEDGRVVITVRDTGHGIDPKDREKIFNPDFTTKPQDKGTGLGLASVFAMVRAYAGTIDCDSGPGRGATFIVRLPVGRGNPGMGIRNTGS